MHYLMLVTVAMSPGANSEDARPRAYSRLLQDNSFCGETAGRFGSTLCDWFVIGGRWSGYLRERLLGQPYQDALSQEFPEFAKGYYLANRAEFHKDGLNQLWQRLGGTGSNPMTRDSYAEHGADDDAMLVDQALYDQFLKPLAGNSVCLDEDWPHRFADLDDEAVNESFIGRKWLVVVDYHN
jgi:hypothetical protein